MHAANPVPSHSEAPLKVKLRCENATGLWSHVCHFVLLKSSLGVGHPVSNQVCFLNYYITSAGPLCSQQGGELIDFWTDFVCASFRPKRQRVVMEPGYIHTFKHSCCFPTSFIIQSVFTQRTTASSWCFCTCSAVSVKSINHGAQKNHHWRYWPWPWLPACT